uniref:Uncharacterized protein n=1 Tax=Arundo donax TaxID=35708 RepID=A0A0A9A758_ARUDO
MWLNRNISILQPPELGSVKRPLLYVLR